MRQAHQRAPQIKGRWPAVRSNDLTYARQPGQQSHQRRLNREDGPPGARGNLRDITTELQRVPVALLGHQQNDPIPNRLLQKRARADLGFRLPVRPKLLPTFLQLPGQQKRVAKGSAPSPIFRSKAQCRAIARLGFSGSPEMMEYQSEIAVSERMLGFEAQRGADAGLGFLKAPEVVEHTSEIVVCIGKVRPQAQCLA